jgi:NAD+ kinase
MQIAIYGRKVSKQNLKSFYYVFELIQSFGWKLMIEEELANSIDQKKKIDFVYNTFNSDKDLKSGVDLVISMGGDGTFLKCVSYIKNSGVPVMGINMGRLGFLANVSMDQISEALHDIKAKKISISKEVLVESGGRWSYRWRILCHE